MKPPARFAALLTAAAMLVLAGCRSNVLPTPSHEAALAQQHAVTETLREQLGAIPPPAKSRFMNIHSFESWENPFLTIQPDMIEVHVLRADENPSPVGAGGMFRPVGARREVVNIAPDKLAEAIAAIPASAWPYGRVIAVEEAHKTPAVMEPQVRRRMEAAVSVLNDLGVEAYDPIEGSLR